LHQAQRYADTPPRQTRRLLHIRLPNAEIGGTGKRQAEGEENGQEARQWETRVAWAGGPVPPSIRI
jgi:hypothetical protein